MSRPLDTRIDRVEGTMAAAAEHGSAAIARELAGFIWAIARRVPPAAG